MGFLDNLSHAWNAFRDIEPEGQFRQLGGYGASYGMRPERSRISAINERSIISSIYTRLSIDVASIDIRHVRLDENGRYKETIKSGLNNCLKVEANLDQGARAFRQDMAASLFDRGAIAIVPVDTNLDPRITDGYDIKTLRVGYVLDWFPEHVRVSVWNQKWGRRDELVLHKKYVAIVENPLYSVMNEPNSTLQRLIRKLNLLDTVDEAAGSGKLDLIIQLPYVIKTDAKRAEAEKRRKDIEMQMSGSRYGIAYTDGTEKVTQLNRPAENNMLKQVEYLTSMLYGQLGLTESVLDGTADEATMINYHNRTIEPILAAISEAMKRTFLTQTARSQGQSIEYFRDPFKLAPISQVAELADKLTRNEVMSSNEFRGVIGMLPSTDPNADKLLNKNIPAAKQDPAASVDEEPMELKQILP